MSIIEDATCASEYHRALQHRLTTAQVMLLANASLGAVADGGADAVGASVAAADDDDVLPGRADVVAVGQAAVQQALRVGRQELHREVHALSVPASRHDIDETCKQRYEFLTRNKSDSHNVRPAGCHKVERNVLLFCAILSTVD